VQPRRYNRGVALKRANLGKHFMLKMGRIVCNVVGQLACRYSWLGYMYLHVGIVGWAASCCHQKPAELHIGVMG
jgi:hypothetical protein